MMQSLGIHKTRIIVILAAVIVCCLFRAVPFAADRKPLLFQDPIRTERIDNRTVFFFPQVKLDRGIYTFSCVALAQVEIQMAVLEDETEDSAAVLRQLTDPLSQSSLVRMMPVRMEAGAGERTLRFQVVKDDVPACVVVRDYYENNAPQEAAIHVSLVYRPMLSVMNAVLETLFFAALLMLAFVVIRKAVVEKKRIPLFLTMLVVWISLPLFAGFLPCGHDTLFHVRRIANLAEELFAGRIPARIAQTWKNGYGYPISIFYGDLFLIPSALLFRLGVPLWQCYRFHTLLISTATVLVSFHCFRIISGDEKPALFGSVLYAGSVRYAANLYPRGAIGEESAMAVLPLVAAGFYLLFRDAREETEGKTVEATAAEDIRRGGLYLTAGYSLLIQVHILTTVQTTIFAVFFCLLYARALFRSNRFRTILLAAGKTALINLWFLVPFVDYYARHSFYAKYNTEVSITTVKLRELIVPDEQFYAIGLGTVLLLAACFVLRKGIPVRLLVMSCVAVWLGTEACPWAWMETHLPLVYGTVGGKIQYVWRYFTIATLLICVMTMLHLRTGAKKAVYAALAVIAAVSLAGSARVMLDYVTPDAGGYVTRATDVWNGDSGDALYMFPDVVWYERAPDVVAAQEGVLFTNVSHRGTTYETDAENTTGAEASLSFPVLNYYGYTARSGGETLPVSDGPDHRIQVTLPAGFSGHLTVGFREPWYWRLSELASAITLIVMLRLFTLKKHD